MTPLWIATALLAVALIAALIRSYRLRPDANELPPQEQVVKIPEEFHGISHITRGDVRLDIERKPKQMKSRPRIKK